MKSTAILSLLIIVALLFACDPNRIYEKNLVIKNRQWYKDSLITHGFTIDDIQSKYNLYFNVRNANEYPFHNLYITYYLTDSTGKIKDSKLLNQNLFDPVTGNPLGDGGIGDVFDHQFSILDDYSFDYQGTYYLKIEQTMRLDPLPEIIAVGCRVEKIPDN